MKQSEQNPYESPRYLPRRRLTWLQRIAICVVTLTLFVVLVGFQIVSSVVIAYVRQLPLLAVSSLLLVVALLAMAIGRLRSKSDAQNRPKASRA